MKKFTLVAIMLLGFLSTAKAIEGFNMGLSLQAGVFEVEGASEKFTGAHSSSASPGDVTKNASAEGENAEGLFANGSIFLEPQINSRLAIGIEYTPYGLESETAENVQNTGPVATGEDAESTNTVQVDFEDLTTIYARLNLGDSGFYAKVGHVSVDVVTNESLSTGGAYDDTSLDGYTVALGLQRTLNTNTFVRFEASMLDMDGATLTNTADATKSVTADGIEGYGAKISIGKSF